MDDLMKKLADACAEANAIPYNLIEAARHDGEFPHVIKQAVDLKESLSLLYRELDAVRKKMNRETE